MRKLIILSGWLLCITGFLAGGLTVLGISGKYNLKRQAVSYAAQTGSMAQTDSVLQAVPRATDDAGKWQEGRIRHNGAVYDYNSDILTFLFMGIDKEKGEKSSGEYADGGQADALFLLVLNSHEKTMQLIPINRNTMTAIAVYDAQGVYQDTVRAQICTQHGFGDGKQESCEYQVRAVSNLLYGIPIHGYLAVDMDVIAEVTDMIGGIDLEALEDIRNAQGQVILRKGEQRRLNGEEAYWYVRDRDSGAPLSADQRLERQGQFLTQMISKVKWQTGQDVTAPLKIFNAISGRAVTNITADEVVYLAAAAGGYRFDAGQVTAIPGKSVSGEENPNSDYDEFYADEAALYELVLAVFYEPVT